MRPGRRGNSMIEFTLVGIPVMFVLISTFEMARGAWMYHTLAYAAKEGTRFASVHGNNCAFKSACTTKVSEVAQVIRQSGVGLNPAELQVTLRNVTDAGTPVRTIGPLPLSTLLSQTASCYPVRDDCKRLFPGATTHDDVEIEVVFPFRSALAMFWPGAGGVTFGVFNLPASSRERIHF